MVMTEEERRQSLAESKKRYYERNRETILPKMREYTRLWAQRPEVRARKTKISSDDRSAEHTIRK
jgi:hypothetical protein